MNEIGFYNGNSTIISMCEIKIEMMDDCKESWLLFCEKKMYRFIKGYEMKKAYLDDKKY
jgi:hypothetical protein